jgi:hypothetical protein
MCIGLRDLNILFNELSPQAHKAGITSLYGWGNWGWSQSNNLPEGTK